MIVSASKPHFLAQPNQDLVSITPTVWRLLNQLLPDLKLVIAQDRPILIDEAFSSRFPGFEHNGVLRHMTHTILQRTSDEFDAVIAEAQTTRVLHVNCIRVTVRKKPAILALIHEVTDQYQGMVEDQRLRKLQEAILRINTSVLLGDDLRKTLDLILGEAILAFPKAGLGTIFTLNGDHFETVSSIGYDEEIQRFKLPVEKSFLYCETNGAMDRIAIVNDIQQRYNFIPVKTVIGDDTYLHSCMVAPLFYRDKLYGVMSIDSLRPDAFGAGDIATMEFIRNNVQIAITNQLTFIEKSRQALTDSLTGLHNRHYLTEQLLFVIEKAKRFEETFCLAVIDVDDLKKINDRHGHLVGDQVIRVLGQALKSTVRQSDLLVRFGGDEFVAVCFTAHVDQLQHRFDDLAHQLRENPLHSDAGEVVISFSVGIAAYPSDAVTSDALITLADQRMYAHKRHPGEPHE